MNKKISYSAIILTIMAIGSLLQFGIALPIAHSASAQSSSTPIKIVSSNWWDSTTRKWGGFVGDANDRLNLVINNSGTVAITHISAVITPDTPNALTNITGGSVIADDPSAYSRLLTGGSNGTTSLNFSVDISSSDSAGPLSINVYLTYSVSPNGPYNLNETVATSVPLYALPSISVHPVASTIQLGGTSKVSFEVADGAGSAINDPSVSLRFLTASAIVVLGTYQINSSSDIPVGSNSVYSFDVTTGPRTVAGTYPGTITLNYIDLEGNSRSADFPVGVTVGGGVDLVLQSSKIVQTLGNLTITGTLVNYGTAAAYYTRVSGHVSASGIAGSSSSDFVGTIQARATAYFSIVVPYSPLPSSATRVSIVLQLAYQNSSGSALSFTNSTAFDLLPASQIPNAPGSEQILIIEAAIVAIVIIVAFFSALSFERKQARYQSQTAPVEKESED
jgi:uncharacterized membrane protein